MRRILFILVFATTVYGCGSERIEQLESENARLKFELDSVKGITEEQSGVAEENARIARERLIEARRKGEKKMDSVIVAKNLKVVKAYFACGDSEANLDLERSVDLLEEELKKHDIEVYKFPGILPEDNQCGYELAHGKRRKKVEGALTDADLALLIEDFYNVNLIK